MSKAIATLEHIRGETIIFGLRSIDPPYDGTETVTCDIKVARNGIEVPPEGDAPVLSAAASFAPASGNEIAAWHFTVTAAQSADLEPGRYITDAKVTYADGAVDYPQPLGIHISERVTS